MTVQLVKCSLCKEKVILVWAVDPFGIPGMTLGWHTPAPHTGLDPVTHFGLDSGVCLGWGLTPDFAQSVAVPRAGGLHLAAHP